MTAVLALLPLLALAVTLVLGRYPGEEHLAAARDRRCRSHLVVVPRPQAAVPRAPAPRPPRLPLLATRCAGRAPPPGGGPHRQPLFT